MKLTDYIRKHLATTDTPLTSAEIAEEVGSTGGEVSKAIYAMLRSGEVLKTETEGARPAYSLNKKHQRKRKAPADEGAPSKKAKAPKAARKAKAGKRATARKARNGTPPPRPLPNEQTGRPVAQADTCTLPRSLVRTLTGFILSSPLVLDGETRAAVVQAVQEAA